MRYSARYIFYGEINAYFQCDRDPFVRHSGARAKRASPESRAKRQGAALDSGSGLRPSRNDVERFVNEPPLIRPDRLPRTIDDSRWRRVKLAHHLLHLGARQRLDI